jgi:hypothetical protein
MDILVTHIIVNHILMRLIDLSNRHSHNGSADHEG